MDMQKYPRLKTKNVLPSSISTGMTFLLICRNNPLNIDFIESEIKELVNRCRKSSQQDQCI